MNENIKCTSASVLVFIHLWAVMIIMTIHRFMIRTLYGAFQRNYNLKYNLEAPQRHNTENSKQIFPGKELHGHSPNFYIHVSVSDLYIPTMDLPILLQENMWTDPGNI